MGQDTRYFSTITVCHYAKDAKTALKQAQAVCDHLNKDDETPDAKVEALHEKPFGCLKATELDIKELKTLTIGEDPIPFPFGKENDDLPF